MQDNRGAIIIGAGFGDEGKGTSVDYFCSQGDVKNVIRFSGGPQTAHNVVTEDGREHTFAQFGSGTFWGVRTILSEFVLVNPFNMAVEADKLEPLIGYDPFDNAIISANALMITPLHVAANRQREINRGANAHGSCGEGIGETRSYVFSNYSPVDPIIVGDLRELDTREGFERLRFKLLTYKSYLEETLPNFAYNDDVDSIIVSYQNFLEDRNFRIVDDSVIYGEISQWKNKNVFEGSQGILLDEDFGFHPHTTWSAVTDRNARTLIAKAGVNFEENFKRVGITRTYTTRHGFGPFPGEFEGDKWTDAYPEKHNAWGRFQGSWRAGLLDLPLLEYAFKVNGGFDEIFLTHCDIDTPGYIETYEGLPVLAPARSKDLVYQQSLTDMLNDVKGNQIVVPVKGFQEISEAIERRLKTKVSVFSFGPKASDKKVSV